MSNYGHSNGKQPSDIFDSYCEYILKNDELFQSDTTYVQKIDGSLVKF